jgi:hypothetical protein
VRIDPSGATPHTHRVIRLLAAGLTLVALSACGSTSGDGGKSSSTTAPSSSSASPSGSPSGASSATYFTNAESDAINAVARPSQAAATRATAAANESRCNKRASKSYAAWRACWHSLLDPYAQKLRAVGGEFRILQVGSFPAACVTALKGADGVFQGFARRVGGLLAGIDSPKRSAQVKALNSYTATIRAIEDGYQKPFNSVTEVCYSPQQLKKLRSSASPSPTS